MATRLATYSRAATFQPRPKVVPRPSAKILKFPPKLGATLARELPKQGRIYLRKGFVSLRVPFSLGISQDLAFQGMKNLWNMHAYRPSNASFPAPSTYSGFGQCGTGTAMAVVHAVACTVNQTIPCPGGPGTTRPPNPNVSPYKILGVRVNYWYQSGNPAKWYANCDSIWQITTGRLAYLGARQLGINIIPRYDLELDPLAQPNQLPSPRGNPLPDPTGLPVRLPRYIRDVVFATQTALGVREAGNAANQRPNERPDPDTDTPPLPRHDRKPPGRQVRERKPKTGFPTWFARILNVVTETDDWLDAAIASMPQKIQCSFHGDDGMYTTLAKAKFVYKNWLHMDPTEFAKQAVYNQIEDYLIGRGSKLEQKQMQEIFEKYGLAVSFMPSTLPGKGAQLALKLSPKEPSKC